METGITVTGYDTGDALKLHAHRGDETGDLEVDAIIVSVGRRPRSENLGLEGSGIGVDTRGFIEVDAISSAQPAAHDDCSLRPTPSVPA